MENLQNKVDIVICVFNNLEYTKRCIDSVKKNTSVPYHLILVDDGSTDGTREYLKTIEKAEVILGDENKGVIVSYNKGLKASKAPYVVILNNDTEVPPNWLESMIEVAESNESIGLVGTLSSASTQYQYYKNFENRTERYLLAPLMVAFFCALIKRKVIDTIGYLDEETFQFAYCDDDDYCLRAKKAGFLIAIDLKILVIHKHRATIGKRSDIKEIHQRSYEALLKKHNLERKPNILVAILHQGNISTELGFRIAQIGMDDRFNVKIKPYSHKPISNNRNIIVKEFLANGYDYLCMIDSDIIPPSNILDLVLVDKDVIGGVCPQWHEDDLYWVVMRKVPDGYQQVPVEERGGLREVDAIGTGCIVIKRNVLEVIKAPFNRKWDEDGIAILGLDFNFCQKAKEKGFKIWAHWDYMCDHKIQIGLLNIYKLLVRTKENG